MRFLIIVLLGIMFVISGKTLFFDGQPHKVDSNDTELFSGPIHGINYYPQKTPWSLFWKHYDADVVATDLQKIRGMGFNTVRVFLPYPVFESADKAVRAQAIASAQDFLAQAERQHLQCVLTLFDFYQNYQDLRGAEAHLNRVVPALKDSPALFAWDLKNELDRDVSQGRKRLQLWINKNILTLRGLDAEHLITIGWSKPEAILDWSSESSTKVDYDTFHYYGRVENLKARLEPIKAAQRQKKHPLRKLVMGEFGYHTWSKDPQDPHIAEHQYNYMNAMLASRLSLGLAGSMVWNLYDYAPKLKEDWVLKRHSFQYHMGLLDVNGLPKPVMKAFETPLFVRDANTLGEPTLNTRRLELVFKTVDPGEVVLSTDVTIQRWRVQPGLQQLSWSVSASEIKALIYLEQNYHVKTPALQTLSGESVPAGVFDLTLRLR